MLGGGGEIEPIYVIDTASINRKCQPYSKIVLYNCKI